MTIRDKLTDMLRDRFDHPDSGLSFWQGDDDPIVDEIIAMFSAEKELLRTAAAPLARFANTSLCVSKPNDYVFVEIGGEKLTFGDARKALAALRDTRLTTLPALKPFKTEGWHVDGSHPLITQTSGQSSADEV